MAKREALLSLKVHKEIFENTLRCRLIIPDKSEMGIVSKNILERIVTTIRAKTSINQ